MISNAFIAIPLVLVFISHLMSVPYSLDMKISSEALKPTSVLFIVELLSPDAGYLVLTLPPITMLPSFDSRRVPAFAAKATSPRITISPKAYTPVPFIDNPFRFPGVLPTTPSISISPTVISPAE